MIPEHEYATAAHVSIASTKPFCGCCEHVDVNNFELPPNQGG
jgi:hypothetical protein